MNLLAVGLLTIGATAGAFISDGVKCGEIRCSTVEYCSPYDNHCKPCSDICDDAGPNYQSRECISDCQEYLHDRRYVLLKQYEDLRGEVGRLWVLVAISTAVAFLSFLAALYLLAKNIARWEKLRGMFRRTFTGTWIKRTANGSGRSGSSSSNNNNSSSNSNRNRVQDDAELGTAKQNGLKLTMPTISASVAPSRSVESGSGLGSASGNSSGSGTRVGSGTPNTTTTSLSRRHPSEDTTLDYAYDNPAMTPSPEAVQLRTKRESSF